MLGSVQVVGMLAWRNLWRNHRRTLIMLLAIAIGDDFHVGIDAWHDRRHDA